jgi:hypothetical protein
MSHANTAFAFSDTAELQVLAAARALAVLLAADQAISRRTVNATMADHFGGSDAEGRWSVRDAQPANFAELRLLIDMLPDRVR